jgi:CheY-like chemotaxis protein
MKKLKIIFVDNDEDEQLFMKEGFEASGLFDIIYQANDGSDLYDYLQERSATPDVILSDLNMPGKNGYDILNWISENERFSHIPVIITSTSSTKTIIEKCLDMGATFYLVKPETFTEYGSFAKKLHGLLKEKGLLKETEGR